jgi:hypothetical protein
MINGNERIFLHCHFSQDRFLKRTLQEVSLWGLLQLVPTFWKDVRLPWQPADPVSCQCPLLLCSSCTVIPSRKWSQNFLIKCMQLRAQNARVHTSTVSNSYWIYASFVTLSQVPYSLNRTCPHVSEQTYQCLKNSLQLSRS